MSKNKKETNKQKIKIKTTPPPHPPKKNRK